MNRPPVRGAWVALLVGTLAAACSGTPPAREPALSLAEASVATDTPGSDGADPYASLVLEDPHGRRIDLAPHRGKVRIFDVWATWCGPCRKIIPQLNALYERYRDRGLVVVGLSVDDQPAMVLQFQRGVPLKYPNGMFNSRAAELLGEPDAVPTTFLVDREGRVRRKFVGLVDRRTLERAVQDLL
ncbi:MAG: TlpA family protein disulfide reductase [Acidobacteriota bacterium]